jgi:hypothetical protein
LELLTAAGETEGKPVAEETTTAFHGSNGASKEDSALPF